MSARIISFDDAKRPDASPSPDLISFDENGRELRTYALSYEFEGSHWSTTIMAYSFDDAERRVQAMRQSLDLRGELHAVIPA